MTATVCKKYILLAEDNLADAFLVQQALEEHDLDYDLRVLSDGEEALAFIDQMEKDSTHPCPELFLLDLHLPKYDGDSILERLRTSKRCGDTPVILLSSSDAPRDRTKAQMQAVVQYFRKPADLTEFMKLGKVIKTFFSGA